MSATSVKTKAIFYLRVSTDRQMDGAAAQLEMLRAAALTLGIHFPVTNSELCAAIAGRQNESEPLYLDFGISGYFDSTRPGYQKFLKRALTDKSVTHVFTPARDRIARPEDAAEFASRENRIRAAGKTLVVGTKILLPLRRGDDNMVDTITASLEYGQGRAYLDSLANKMVTVKANKAKAGCWTGGRAPYGFVRVLVNPQGVVERALRDGESVRQPGYNISLRVGDVERIRVWHDLILKNFDPAGGNVGGKQVANLLNTRNVPSADAGRSRRTQYDELPRLVPGTWTPGMIYAMLDNPAIVGVLRYGKRSMGEHARLGENGIPRKLTNDEAPSPDAPSKIVENPEDIQISVPGGWMSDDGWLLNAAGKKCFKVDMDLWKRCQKKRKDNAGSQRGMARCHDPYKYPMAGLLRCAHCGSVMHGVPYGKTLRYMCGTYANSGGAKCEHNWVAQDDLLPNILRVIQECALPSVEQLRNTLRKMVAETLDKNSQASNLVVLKKECEHQAKVVTKSLEAVSAAQDDQEREGLRKIYRRERAKLEGLETQLGDVQALHGNEPSEELVSAAIDELKNLRAKLVDTTDRRELATLFRAMNLRVFLKFKKIRWGKKRMINKVESSELCLGSAPNPLGAASLGKVNRGDRI